MTLLQSVFKFVWKALHYEKEISISQLLWWLAWQIIKLVDICSTEISFHLSVDGSSHQQ